MIRHMRQIKGILVLAALVTLASTAQAQIEDPDLYPGTWYRIEFDEDGNYSGGDGDGSGWYYYPTADRYRMWFENGAYDPNRKGYLEYWAYIMPVKPGASSSCSIYFNWTTPEWSALGNKYPPMPEDVPTMNEENEYMSGANLHSFENLVNFESIEPVDSMSINEYNPDWVSIDIRGKNVRVYRYAFHDCLAKNATRLGACCNRRTGFCYTTYERDCESPYEWLGGGSSCDECTATAGATLDFGDAPDPSYPTLLASDGPRHKIVPGMFLGRNIDGEADGRPNALADGDDKIGGDEDGVKFISGLQRGVEADVEVGASAEGYLNAWIDFNADGDFDDRGEQVFADVLLATGVNPLTFLVPAEAAQGPTFARFRFNSRGLLGSTGPAEDGEVEDYRIQIATHFEPHAASGASAVQWDQPPSAPGAAEPYFFEAGAELSAFHVYQMAADDWQLEEGRPVTGIHWWGTFEEWTESSLPPDLPLAFHLGIWTDKPDPEPFNFDTFAHPDTLIWESYCTSWTWSLAGYEKADKGEMGATCFLFTHLLSQDQWFEAGRTMAASGPVQPGTYWLSIAAIYDLKAREPSRLWGWKTRPGGSGAACTVVQGTTTPQGTTSWPPTAGWHWGQGETVRDRQFKPIDLAFQLTTYTPLEASGDGSVKPEADAGLNADEAARLVAHWLATTR